MQENSYQTYPGSATSYSAGVSIVLPSTPTAGNLLFVACVPDKNVGSFSSTPSGWTLLEDNWIGNMTSGVGGAVYYKVAEGTTEERTAAFAWTTSSRGYAIWIGEYSGIGAVHEVGTATATATSVGTSVTNTAGTTALAFHCIESGNSDTSGTWTSSTGNTFTQEVATTTNSGVPVIRVARAVCSTGSVAVNFAGGPTSDERFVILATCSGAAVDDNSSSSSSSSLSSISSRSSLSMDVLSDSSQSSSSSSSSSSSGVGSNAEVAAWDARVTAAGGSASSAQLGYLTTFLDSLSSTVRGKIIRFNPFIGGLNGALQPLIRSTSADPSVVVGGAADTNTNFVSGDYVDNIGLTGDGTSKSLNTGVAGNVAGLGTSGLFGAYTETTVSGTTSSTLLGCSTTSFLRLAYSGTQQQFVVNWCVGSANVTSLNPVPGFIVGTRRSTTNQEIYVDGVSVADRTTADTLTAVAPTIEVFARNNNGTVLQWWVGDLGCYVIAAQMTATEVGELSDAVNALMTSLGRKASTDDLSSDSSPSSESNSSSSSSSSGNGPIIAIASTTAGSTSSGTTLVINRPTYQTGDVIVIAVNYRNAGDIASIDGFTKVYGNSGQSTYNGAVFYKVGGASEPASYIINLSSSAIALAIAATFRVSTGADGSNSGTAATNISASVTTTTAGCLMIAAAAANVNSVTTFTSTDMNEINQHAIGSNADNRGSLGLFDCQLIGSGASGAKTITSATASWWVSLALKR